MNKVKSNCITILVNECSVQNSKTRTRRDRTRCADKQYRIGEKKTMANHVNKINSSGYNENKESAKSEG